MATVDLGTDIFKQSLKTSLAGLFGTIEDAIPSLEVSLSGEILNFILIRYYFLSTIFTLKLRVIRKYGILDIQTLMCKIHTI